MRTFLEVFKNIGIVINRNILDSKDLGYMEYTVVIYNIVN